MSAGTDASQIGYGRIAPLSNINGKYVNVDNSNSPSRFGSNEISGLPGLSGAKSNIDAAMGKVPGICLFKGGSRGIKRKIKNIVTKYKKMKGGKRRCRTMKKRIRSKMAKKRVMKSRRRMMRGGYSQYQNNLPMTPSYAVGGHLSANHLALANPPPIKVYPNCANCTDNYNHFTGKGFPSRGH
jgi:hypothetical protein